MTIPGFNSDNLYQDQPPPPPPGLPGEGALAKRVGIAMFAVALAAGVMAALAGLPAWKAVALMWGPALIAAFGAAIWLNRQPEVKQYRAEYRKWREEQLARGRSRWSVDLEQVRTTTTEQGVKPRDLVILLLHLLLVLAPVGALFTLFGWVGGRW